MRGWGVRRRVHGIVLSRDGCTIGAVHGGCRWVGGGRVMLCERRRIDGIVVVHHIVDARVWLEGRATCGSKPGVVLRVVGCVSGR